MFHPWYSGIVFHILCDPGLYVVREEFLFHSRIFRELPVRLNCKLLNAFGVKIVRDRYKSRQRVVLAFTYLLQPSIYTSLFGVKRFVSSTISECLV